MTRPSLLNYARRSWMHSLKMWKTSRGQGGPPALSCLHGAILHQPPSGNKRESPLLMVKKAKTEQRSGVASTQAVTPKDTTSFGGSASGGSGSSS